MPQDDVKPLRSWRELAKLTAEEHDPDKALELAQQLIQALDAQSRKRMDQVNAHDKAQGHEAA